MRKAVLKRHQDPSLCDAAAEGDLRRLRQMLRSDVHPDSADEDGTTALMAGAFAAQIEVVRELLEAGADPNLQDVSGYTALMNAVIGNGEMDLDGAHPLYLEIVEALLEAGAEVRTPDEDGMTARSHAASYGLDEILTLLDNHVAAGRRRR